MAEVLRFLTLTNATAHSRIEQFDGREYIVVPTTALVEGVIHPVNAPTPEFVAAEEFEGSLGEWDRRPIFAGHPMRDGVPVSGNLPDILPKSFGFVRDASAANKRLCMDVWMDPLRAAGNTHAEAIVAAGRENKPIEVSVGVFTNAEKREGTHNGKRFAAAWKGMRPDHLALFADGRRGACSIEMGCGTHRVAMRVAESGELELEVKKPTLLSRFLAAFRTAMPGGWTDVEVRQELRDELLAREPGMANGDVISFTDKRVVYCLWPSMNQTMPNYGPASPEYYARDYRFEDGKCVLDDREEVEPTMTYPAIKAAEEIVPELPVTPTPQPCSCGNHAVITAGEENMDRKERIAALVANPHSPVKSLKMLGEATDEELTSLETQAGGIKAAAEKATTDAAALVKAQADLKTAQDALAAPITEDQLPEAYRTAMAAQRAAEQAEKDTLVGKLKAAQTAYTEDELKALSTVDLKKLATLAKVDVVAGPRVLDFSGKGVPRVAADAGENFAPPDSYAAALATK